MEQSAPSTSIVNIDVHRQSFGTDFGSIIAIRSNVFDPD